MPLNSYLLIITLNVNEINAPQKSHMDKTKTETKQKHIYAAYERFILDPEKCRLKVRGWRTIYHTNGRQKKANVVILISDILDAKAKTVTRDEERPYMIIKGSIQQEDLTIVNIYA